MAARAPPHAGRNTGAVRACASCHRLRRRSAVTHLWRKTLRLRMHPASSLFPEVDVEEAAAGTRARRRFSRASINAFDQSRDTFLLPKFGASSYVMDQQAIQALPQGNDTPIDKALFQALRGARPTAGRRCSPASISSPAAGCALGSVICRACSPTRNSTSRSPGTSTSGKTRSRSIYNFTVVNLLDTLYLLRSGDGVGEFAPQYGPRRGLYATLTQKF